MYKNLIENVYNFNDIDYNLLTNTNEELNSFVKVLPGVYPPRMNFNMLTHNLKKDNIYILKFVDKGRATFAINNKEVKIIDIFIDADYQGQSIVKDIVKFIKLEIMREYPTIEFITLNSLNTGIIAWHKIGFEFYNRLDKMGIKKIISEHLKEKIDLKDLTKDIVESNDCYQLLEDNNFSGIPMYLRIKK